jgi:hypothetical protein
MWQAGNIELINAEQLNGVIKINLHAETERRRAASAEPNEK